MKILLVTEDIPVPNLGGAGRHAVTLGNALMAAGHEVELLGRNNGLSIPDRNGFQGILHQGIVLSKTGWQEHRFGAFLPYRRHHVARRIWSAIERLDPERFDVIHYHGHVAELGSIVPDSFNFVHTIHDQGSDCLKFTRFIDGEICRETLPEKCAGCATPQPNWLQSRLSACAVKIHRKAAVEAFTRHKVIFVAEFLRERFNTNVQPTASLRANTIHNFLNVGALESQFARLPAGSIGTRPRVLLAGRVDAYKGFTEFFDAVPDSLLQRCEFRLAGEGPDMPRLLERHGKRNITFLGFLSPESVYAETLRAAACIVPSIWEEPCATTILEALGAGRPVWALKRGGSPELLRYQAYPGQLHLHADMHALAADLETSTLCDDEPEINRLASVESRLNEIVKVYDEVRV